MPPLTAVTLTLVITLTTFGAGRPAPLAWQQPPPQQAEDLAALNRRVLELYEAKKYGEAARLAQTALEAAERQSGPDSLETSAALMNFASVEVARRDMKKARKSLVRLVEMRAKRAGPSKKFEQSALELFVCVAASDPKDAPDPELIKRIHSIFVEDSVLEQGFRISPDRAELKGGELLNKPQPKYPRMALDARASGGVVVRVTIDEEGRVVEATPLNCSANMLAGAGAEAARRATFNPTLVNGKPVRVRSIIHYRFVIQ